MGTPTLEKLGNRWKILIHANGGTDHERGEQYLLLRLGHIDIMSPRPGMKRSWKK
jgi:hypothetical protein